MFIVGGIVINGQSPGRFKMPIMPGVDYVGGVAGPTHGGPTGLKWDPKNLEIRTTSVERTLEPLVIQVKMLS